MARPRNIPIDLAQGVTKDVTIICSDGPDLSPASICMTIKRHATDVDTILTKGINLAKSTKLKEGQFVISFDAADTALMDARTYIYEVRIILGDFAYVPLIGDFLLFKTIG